MGRSGLLFSSLTILGWCLLVSTSAASVGTAVPAVATPNAAPITNAVKKSPTCCKALAVLLPKKVFTPEGKEYQKTVGSFWSLQEQQVRPACVVIPEKTEDVSYAVGVLNIGSKLLHGKDCRFAVKSGGHTPFAGSASSEGGVTIDLSKLNQVDVYNDQSKVSIGPGNTWADVYLKLDALGIATSGGRASTVGVGGLTLGGGFSFFSPRYGLVCDNVLNFEIVLATGQVVNVNARSYPDLFKALKGGAGNFGVVTRFDMKTFKQGKFWGGFIGQNISTRQQQYEYFEEFAQAKNYDPYATIINSYSWNAQTDWFIASDYEYTKPQAYPPVFKKFVALPQNLNTMRISNLTDFTIEIDARNVAGSRQSFVTATFKNSAIMQAEYFNLANATLYNSLLNVSNLTYSLSFQPEPEALLVPLSYSSSNTTTNLSSPLSSTSNITGNALGLTPSDGDLVNVLLTIQWSSSADDARVKAASQSLFAQADAFAKKNGFDNDYLYLNYAAEWQDPLSGYGEESLRFLKAVSAKYDPEQLFQKGLAGGFKLIDAVGLGKGVGSTGGGATAGGSSGVGERRRWRARERVRRRL